MNASPRKCQAKGGPASCSDPNCPEKQYHVTLPAEFNKLAALPKPLPMVAWTEENTELFKTIHGSKLYGLDHPESDDDWYVVTPTKRTKRALNAKHRKNGDLDTVTVDFHTFTVMAQNGVPQALEAMFSQKSTSPFFEPYRTGWFASDPEVVSRYLRTIHAFSLDDSDKQEKYHRHALRLSLNLDELVHTGRFNPTLNPVQAEYVRRTAAYSPTRYFRELNAVNPFDLDWTYDNA